MRKLLFLATFSIFPFFAKDVHAQNIQTGNASAQSSVETNIEGSGNVQTHIEVQANGEKKTLDAQGPGTYNVSVQSNGNNAQNTNSTPTSQPTPSVKPPPVKQEVQIKNDLKNQNKNPFNQIQEMINNLIIQIKKLFSGSTS